jgi:hypothetical protein
MDAQSAALIGALIGASAAVVSSSVSVWLQRRHEHQKWLRDKKQEAYSNVLRLLFRLKYKRSGITAEGSIYLDKEDGKLFFEDLATLAESLSSLKIFANKEYEKNIAKHADKLRLEMDAIVNSYNRPVTKDKQELADKLGIKPGMVKIGIFGILNTLEKEITYSATRDLNIE